MIPLFVFFGYKTFPVHNKISSFSDILKKILEFLRFSKFSDSLTTIFLKKYSIFLVGLVRNCSFVLKKG